MKLVICGIDEANKLLADPADGFDNIISIMDPQAREPDSIKNIDSVPNRLIIDFHDVESTESDWQHPTIEDAKTILDFAEDKINSSWLVHCHQGKSRSAAVGLMLCARVYGVAQSKEELLKVRPNACPNVLLSAHFDSLCGFNGALKERALDFDYQALRALAGAV